MKSGSRVFLLFFAASLFCPFLSSVWGQQVGREAALSPRQILENVRAKKYSGKRIDLVLPKAGLQEVMARLEKAGGVRLELDPSINDKVTYRMYDIRWDEALGVVLSDNALRIDLNLDETGFKIGRGAKVILAFKNTRQAKLVLFLYAHIFHLVAGAVLLTAVLFGLRLYRKRRIRLYPVSKRTPLPAEAVEQTKKKLLHILEIEKIYRDEDLTLQTLAEKIAVSPHQLSWIINEGLGRSFSSLINGYRVEDVKSRLSDPTFNHSSILKAAMDAGFNTKASFNRAFKKVTGTTPSQYKRDISR